MEGKINRIIESGKLITIIIWLKTGEYGRTYTGTMYRNYEIWKDLKVGDHITGLAWKDKVRKIIDGDSPVSVLV